MWKAVLRNKKSFLLLSCSLPPPSSSTNPSSSQKLKITGLWSTVLSSKHVQSRRGSGVSRDPEHPPLSAAQGLAYSRCSIVVERVNEYVPGPARRAWIPTGVRPASGPVELTAAEPAAAPSPGGPSNEETPLLKFSGW